VKPELQERTSASEVATDALRALVVDDEAPARRSLQILLESHPEIQMVGECASGPEAVEAIERYRPDLLFLDIQLPGFNGFEVLRRAKVAFLPNVIFVTAYDEHAIHAFDVQAVDYLLKPFEDERFELALERAKSRIRQSHLNVPSPLERLAVRAAGRILLVRVSDIDWIAAQDYYVELHVGGQSHLIRERMHNLEARLDPHRFVRIHRSSIVNIARVKELRLAPHGEYRVLLHDGRSSS
jgi:two-component system LytT family response regulator